MLLGIGTTADSPTPTLLGVGDAARKQKRTNIAAALLNLLFPEITRLAPCFRVLNTFCRLL